MKELVNDNLVEERELLSEEKWLIKNGEKINFLTMIGPVYLTTYPSGQKGQKGLFECDCGKQKEIIVNNVLKNRTKSCGCKKGQIRMKGSRASDGFKICSNPKCRHNRAKQPTCNFNKSEKKIDKLTSWCKDCLKIKCYERLYGHPYCHYEQRLISQNNLCDLCGMNFTIGNKRTEPCQDHNHDTGKLRGVVHNVCNLLIELCESFSDFFPPNEFRMVDNYLKRWEQINVQDEKKQKCLATAV